MVTMLQINLASPLRFNTGYLNCVIPLVVRVLGLLYPSKQKTLRMKIRILHFSSYLPKEKNYEARKGTKNQLEWRMICVTWINPNNLSALVLGRMTFRDTPAIKGLKKKKGIISVFTYQWV